MSTAEQTITTKQQEWLDGARAMIKWFEQHPERIPDYGIVVNLYPGGKSALAELARALGKAEKHMTVDLFYITRRFGLHKINGTTLRREVCRRVITGTKLIPEKVVPAHVEEIVEWVCDEPLLKVGS